MAAGMVCEKGKAAVQAQSQKCGSRADSRKKGAPPGNGEAKDNAANVLPQCYAALRPVREEPGSAAFPIPSDVHG